jgi:hypothetical protein
MDLIQWCIEADLRIIGTDKARPISTAANLPIVINSFHLNFQRFSQRAFDLAHLFSQRFSFTVILAKRWNEKIERKTFLSDLDF